jgi:hypothetical protein
VEIEEKMRYLGNLTPKDQVEKCLYPFPNQNPALVEWRGKDFIYQKAGLLFKENRCCQVGQRMNSGFWMIQNALNIGWFSDI